MSEQHILRRGEIVPDRIVHLADDEAIPSTGDLTVSLERYAKERDSLRAHAGRVGVRLEPGQRGDELAEYIDELEVVAVDFPKFTDGRGYSTARRLRERMGFAGELRATGDVLPDQVSVRTEIRARRFLQSAILLQTNRSYGRRRLSLSLSRLVVERLQVGNKDMHSGDVFFTNVTK